MVCDLGVTDKLKPSKKEIKPMKRTLIAMAIALLISAPAFAVGPNDTTNMVISGGSTSEAYAQGNQVLAGTFNKLNLAASAIVPAPIPDSGIIGKTTGMAQTGASGTALAVTQSGVLGNLNLTLAPKTLSGLGGTDQLANILNGAGATGVSGNTHLVGWTNQPNLTGYVKGTALDQATDPILSKGGNNSTILLDLTH